MPGSVSAFLATHALAQRGMVCIRMLYGSSTSSSRCQDSPSKVVYESSIVAVVVVVVVVVVAAAAAAAAVVAVVVVVL